MECLNFPFDVEYIFSKQKKIRRELLHDGSERIQKKIAILAGSTVSQIVDVLELFLLNYGIQPEFWVSEYNMYYESAVFENQELEIFSPDLIYIFTSEVNIKSDVNTTYEHFKTIWQSLKNKYNCPIIQNNFELPFYRVTGNISAVTGRVNVVNLLNCKFAEYAENNSNFYINDINYVSACFGLDKWASPQNYYLYKIIMSSEAIPNFAFNIANIIKSIYGKNKKALCLDLDNTLWGGVVGDDGVDGIEIGQETHEGQAFFAFQSYLKQLKNSGVLLTIISKNEKENAIAGLNKQENVLAVSDFAMITANWEPKDLNVLNTAAKLNILPESLVFVDDNPAERHIVAANCSGVAVPEMTDFTEYIRAVDKNGYFEVTNISNDDLARTEMYQANAQRERQIAAYANYDEYLESLEMTAEIRPFDSNSIPRITQLINKSNQFNLTTRRYTQSEIEDIAKNPNFVTLYGRLIDKFGDNGIVSVIITEKTDEGYFIRLFLMSCRVLKRGMENAMINALVESTSTPLFGEYIPTKKNKMVENLYADFGFDKISEENGTTFWKLNNFKPFDVKIKI